MKLSTALIMASMATSVAATKSISAKHAAKVLKAARRVEEGEEGDDAAEEEEFAFLTNYSLKMIGCKAGEIIQNPENQEYEYGAAMFRLCPTSSGCDDESVTGCSEGFGDYVVGLNTFVDAFFEDQRDNMNWDDQFEVDRYAECAEYEVEAAEDDANDPYANYQFFIGPTCTEDELDVKLALFSEETCTYASEFTFEEISNGLGLPYDEGGMVSTYCQDCLAYNDDGEAELRDMCMKLYEETASACEENMEYYSQYGPNDAGCEYIEELLPASAQSSNGGKVFGIIVVIVLVVGAIGYVGWWRSKKAASADGLVA